MKCAKELAEQALQNGNGILRLAPTWVPRSFCRPGKRIKLAPEDYTTIFLANAEELMNAGFHLQHGRKMVPAHQMTKGLVMW